MGLGDLDSWPPAWPLHGSGLSPREASLPQLSPGARQALFPPPPLRPLTTPTPALPAPRLKPIHCPPCSPLCPAKALPGKLPRASQRPRPAPHPGAHLPRPYAPHAAEACKPGAAWPSARGLTVKGPPRQELRPGRPGCSAEAEKPLPGAQVMTPGLGWSRGQAPRSAGHLALSLHSSPCLWLLALCL